MDFGPAVYQGVMAWARPGFVAGFGGGGSGPGVRGFGGSWASLGGSWVRGSVGGSWVREWVRAFVGS